MITASLQRLGVEDNIIARPRRPAVPLSQSIFMASLAFCSAPSLAQSVASPAKPHVKDEAADSRSSVGEIVVTAQKICLVVCEGGLKSTFFDSPQSPRNHCSMAGIEAKFLNAHPTAFPGSTHGLRPRPDRTR